MNIISAKDIKHDRITALIYGTPGTGKTTLLGCLQGRTLIVDIDKGSSVLAGKDNIDILSVDGNSRLLYEVPQQFKQTCPYDNIAIDTVSELERTMLSNLAARNNNGLPTLQDYGNVNHFMLNLCRQFRNINANIFFTAWEQYTEVTSPTGETYSRIEPLIRQKNMENICGLCDIIGRIYYDKDTNSRRVWLEGRPHIVARDRIFKRSSCSFEEVVNNEH